MGKARKAILIFSSVFLAFSLSVLVITQCLLQTIKSPTAFEKALASSGIYGSAISDEINVHKNKVIVGNIYVSTPWVKQDLQKTFNPPLLKSDTNTVINGIYPWVIGKKSAPSFSINLGAQQQQVEDGILNYVYVKLDQLPSCSINYLLSHLQGSPDPYALTCIPPFASQNLLNSQVKEQLENISLFSLSISENNLKLNGSQTIAQQFSYLPVRYKELNAIRYLSVATSVAFMLTILFAHRMKKNGFRLILASATFSGFICVLTSLSDSRLEKLFISKIGSSLTESQPFQPYIKSVTDNLVNTICSNVRLTGIILIIVGLLGWIIFRFLLRDKPSKIVVVTNPR